MELTFRKFFDAKKVVDDGNQAAVNVLSAHLTAQAKALAPVNYGQLRNGIMFRTNTAEGGFNENLGGGGFAIKRKTGKGAETAERKVTSPVPPRGVGLIGINLDHAIYQEFGTRYMPPQPYLRPAIALVVYGRAAKIIAEEINKEVSLGSLTTTGMSERVRFY